MSVPIVPAVIPQSGDALRAAFAQLDFAPELSIDVVDGEFVPFTSWPYEPPGDPAAISHLLTSRTVEVDLMVREQLAAATKWQAAGADMVVFHLPGITVEDFARFAETARVSCGVSLLNGTPLVDLAPFVPYADYLQFMGIAEIGSQGQPFDTRVLDRIRAAKAAYPELPITVDGSVNEATLAELVAAGADRLIVGSAIVKAADPAAAYDRLVAACTGAQ